MSNATPQAAKPATAPKPHKSPPPKPERVYLVSYPKLVFLYPTFIASLAAGIFMSIAGDGDLTVQNREAVLAASAFLCVFAVNLVVISFDFPRTTSLTLFFFIAAIVLGLFLLGVYKPGVLPFLQTIVNSLHPVANATFFYLIAGVLAVLFAGMFLLIRFDYWEVRPNELLHHHGVLSDLKRYSAPELRIDKEVNDVFEYLLLRSGRLILHPSGETRSIVLDNVPFITRKEETLTRMLGALQVQVRREPQ